ncbi:hypothetical protein H1C71_033360 [Ictidomys tridecemlineatus]|nr:hypothetical protein H1C71_033360 [Ictidomys tridecemlineatus]KAG3282766.1 hypothetical protein H1C71_033360 [Ictidomys tridecemlineatus]
MTLGPLRSLEPQCLPTCPPGRLYTPPFPKSVRSDRHLAEYCHFHSVPCAGKRWGAPDTGGWENACGGSLVHVKDAQAQCRSCRGLGPILDFLHSRKPAALHEVGTVNPITKEGQTPGRSHGRAEAGGTGAP